jgi:hypothetical protein
VLLQLPHELDPAVDGVEQLLVDRRDAVAEVPDDRVLTWIGRGPALRIRRYE